MNDDRAQLAAFSALREQDTIDGAMRTIHQCTRGVRCPNLLRELKRIVATIKVVVAASHEPNDPYGLRLTSSETRAQEANDKEDM